MNRFLLLSGLLLVTGAGCQKKTVDPTTGCRLTATIDSDTYTYQFDPDGRIRHLAQHTASTDLAYAYAYQGKQATIDVTYPHSIPNWLRFHYELTLNEQGHVLTAQQTQYNTLPNGTENARLTYSHTCSYDAQGYLLTHHLDSYTYPSATAASPQPDKTTDTQFRYQDGNPVTIRYEEKAENGARSSGTILNQYGTQSNPLPVPFLLEANPFGYSPDRALQPLLGKPPRTLVTNSALTGTVSMATRYAYRTTVSGQLVEVGRVSVPVISAPFSFSFDQRCP